MPHDAYDPAAAPSWLADDPSWTESPALPQVSSWRVGDPEPLVALDLAALSQQDLTPKQFAVERLAPAGEVTLFTGPGSAGKSLLAQQLATAAAAGAPCIRFNVAAGPAIYLTCEDDAEQLHWRQAHICAAMGVDMADLAGMLHLYSLRGEIGNELCTFAQDARLLTTPSFQRLTAAVKATAAKLICLDNVAHLFAGNENDRGEVTRFVNLLNRLAGETGAAIILIGHPNKAGADYSGSTAWLNAVRSQFTMEHDLETDVRTLRVGKANYDRKGDASRFVWQDWAFVHEDDLPPDKARERAEVQQASADNQLFLACLRERIKQQRAVSERRGPTFAPTEFAKMSESKSIGKERLEKAMDRLFRRGLIERAELWRGPDRKPVFGLRETAGNGAGNGAGDVRETILRAAENRAGSAGRTHTIPTGYAGVAPEGPPTPADDDLDWDEGADDGE